MIFSQEEFNLRITKVKDSMNKKGIEILLTTDPSNMKQYNLELQFDHSETEGELFDEMDMKLQAIASMTGMTGIFELQAADVYKVLSIND